MFPYDVHIFHWLKLHIPLRFLFGYVALETGENLFHAVATDSSENVSPPSEQLLVTLDSSGI